jgi:hypothetical protein
MSKSEVRAEFERGSLRAAVAAICDCINMYSYVKSCINGNVAMMRGMEQNPYEAPKVGDVPKEQRRELAFWLLCLLVIGIPMLLCCGPGAWLGFRSAIR